MHTLFNNNTNCTNTNTTCEELTLINFELKFWLGLAAFVFMLCVGCCIYECANGIAKARKAQLRFKSLGLLEPLHSIEIPGILEETPSGSSLIN